MAFMLFMKRESENIHLRLKALPSILLSFNTLYLVLQDSLEKLSSKFSIGKKKRLLVGNKRDELSYLLSGQSIL